MCLTGKQQKINKSTITESYKSKSVKWKYSHVHFTSLTVGHKTPLTSLWSSLSVSTSHTNVIYSEAQTLKEKKNTVNWSLLKKLMEDLYLCQMNVPDLLLCCRSWTPWTCPLMAPESVWFSTRVGSGQSSLSTCTTLLTRSKLQSWR